MQESPALRKLPKTDLIDSVAQPPGYGEPVRDGIVSMIDATLTGLCNESAALKKELGLIEQRAIAGAASMKQGLMEYVSLTAELHAEVVRVHDKVTSLMERSREPS